MTTLRLVNHGWRAQTGVVEGLDVSTGFLSFQHDGSVVQMLKLLNPEFVPQYQTTLGAWLTAGLSLMFENGMEPEPLHFAVCQATDVKEAGYADWRRRFRRALVSTAGTS